MIHIYFYINWVFKFLSELITDKTKHKVKILITNPMPLLLHYFHDLA